MIFNKHRYEFWVQGASVSIAVHSDDKTWSLCRTHPAGRCGWSTSPGDSECPLRTCSIAVSREPLETQAVRSHSRWLAVCAGDSRAEGIKGKVTQKGGF